MATIGCDVVEKRIRLIIALTGKSEQIVAKDKDLQENET